MYDENDDTQPLVLEEVEETEADPQEEEEEELLAVQFGDEEIKPEEEPEETGLVKHLREQLREQSRELRTYRKQAPAVQDDPEPVIGKEPDLEDFDYDTEAYREAVRKHTQTAIDHEKWQSRQAERQRATEAKQQEVAARVAEQRRNLHAPDYDAVKDRVQETLNDMQMGILLNGVDNPAAVVYALGKRPALLDKLAGMENIAKFAVELGKVEKDIKLVKKSTAPKPESIPRGSAPISGGSHAKQLAKLEAEAAKSGNRTALIRYKKENNLN